MCHSTSRSPAHSRAKRTRPSISVSVAIRIVPGGLPLSCNAPATPTMSAYSPATRSTRSPVPPTIRYAARGSKLSAGCATPRVGAGVPDA